MKNIHIEGKYIKCKKGCQPHDISEVVTGQEILLLNVEQVEADLEKRRVGGVQGPTLRHLISSFARLVWSLISSKSISAYGSGLAILIYQVLGVLERPASSLHEPKVSG